jgi:hypothetical protein
MGLAEGTYTLTHGKKEAKAYVIQPKHTLSKKIINARMFTVL